MRDIREIEDDRPPRARKRRATSRWPRFKDIAQASIAQAPQTAQLCALAVSRHGRGISTIPPAHQICGSRHGQTFRLPDQQLCARRFDDCQTIQVPLASGAILQMDQTTLAHQDLLWNLRQCGEDAGPAHTLGELGKLGGLAPRRPFLYTSPRANSVRLEMEILDERYHHPTHHTHRRRQLL